MTLYEDEELRQELGKLSGQDFYPLSDVPEIQAEYIRQLDEEKEKTAAVVADASKEVANIEAGVNQISVTDSDTTAVATLEQRQRNTLPVREKPERSVRLMKEKGMLRKYD